MFFYHFLQLCPRGHTSKMLAVTVIKNTVTKRLWNFQIRFLPYSNAFEEKFFFQTCSFIIFFNFVPEVIPRKCLLLPLLKTRLLSANFQIRFLPYSNAFEEKFFFQTCSFIIFFNFVPEVIPRKCLLYPLLKTRLLSAFGIFKSVSCLIRMRLRKNFFFKHVLLSFSSTLSPRSYLENACYTRY